ncbi:unnamed protein product [Cuscuta europaea]|uniref:Uncharacterized protein n=1 Tax=Cuscuta europaea TaxID=41803 RepID=A0A9P0YHY5_CUSEU|nr:unnamed protein product [Cuscuta europaea]
MTTGFINELIVLAGRRPRFSAGPPLVAACRSYHRCESSSQWSSTTGRIASSSSVFLSSSLLASFLPCYTPAICFYGSGCCSVESEEQQHDVSGDLPQHQSMTLWRRVQLRSRPQRSTRPKTTYVLSDYEEELKMVMPTILPRSLTIQTLKMMIKCRTTKIVGVFNQ